jgi:HTH-type transcriptional regulator / antitoxin HipB
MLLDANFMQAMPNVGSQFKALRKQAAKTQGEVAAAAGMRQEALSRFESGSAADFSLAKLLRLLQALNLELDFKAASRRPTLSTVLQERQRHANTGPNAR